MTPPKLTDEQFDALTQAHPEVMFSSRDQYGAFRLVADLRDQQWQEMLAKQEPVAMRYNFDGYGWLYIDSGSGSDWHSRHQDSEPLYPHPAPDQAAVMRQIHGDLEKLKMALRVGPPEYGAGDWDEMLDDAIAALKQALGEQP